ncbi:hypothetical protein ACSMXM_01225 [Pacificimonas sp. ICDLI1SI03]
MSAPAKERCRNSDSCGNAGFDDRFTCPSCYQDFNHDIEDEDAGADYLLCENCGDQLRVHVEQQPVATAINADNYDWDEDVAAERFAGMDT